jgi:hypothetical protein
MGGTGQTNLAAITSSAQSNAAQKGNIFVQVVDGNGMTPIAGISVLAGPTLSPNDVENTPGGPTLRECVDEVPSGWSVYANGTAVSGTTTITFRPCPLLEYTTNATGWVAITTETNSSFYFIKAGSINEWNDLVVGVEPNSTLKMTFPLPSGNITIPEGYTAATRSGNVTRTASEMTMPVYWPPTTLLWPCGGGLPSGSAVTGQGVYAGMYIAYSFANFPNGTKAALPSYCPGEATEGIIGLQVVVSGALTVPNGTGLGVLVISARNNGNGPVTLITVGVDATDSGVSATSGGDRFSPGGSPYTLFSGSLPVGQLTSSAVQLSGVSAGQTYTFTVMSYFSGGKSPAVETFSVTAQA